jgi:hypothetical protein
VPAMETHKRKMWRVGKAGKTRKLSRIIRENQQKRVIDNRVDEEKLRKDEGKCR